MTSPGPLLLDFLRYHNLHRSADVLASELAAAELRSPDFLAAGGVKEAGAATSAAVKARMLAAFDSGDADSFFRDWKTAVTGSHAAGPGGVDAEAAGKMAFYAHIAFAVQPLREESLAGASDVAAAADAAAAAMQRFKRFLESAGQLLAQTAEFLPYYALPFVPTPAEHPSFAALFEEGWLSDLRSRLAAFLDRIIVDRKPPRLAKLLQAAALAEESKGDRPAGESDDEGDAERTEEDERSEGKAAGGVESGGEDDAAPSAVKKGKKKGGAAAGGGAAAARQLLADEKQRAAAVKAAYVKREGKLRDFTRSVFNVAVELYNALAETKRGRRVAPDFLQYIKGRLSAFGDVLGAPHLKTMRVRGRPAADGSLSGSGDAAGRAGDARGAHARQRQQRPALAPLDYAKLKRALQSAAVDERPTARSGALLLQALRWRLMRSRAGSSRRRVLAAYVAADLLGCRSRTESQSRLLPALLQSASRHTREYSARLINAIASECAGRSYLLQHGALLSTLVALLTAAREDSLARQNALGTLQKFSLRRAPQSAMIAAGLIGWIVRTLRADAGVGRLSKYTLEYGIALLMNLSLRTAGKDECERADVGILDMLVELLESENSQVRAYVNGTLYSVLTRASLKERALAMGLDSMLTSMIARSRDQFRKQLQYILEQLRSEQRDEASDDEEDDDEEDDIDSDAEEEDDDGGDDDDDDESLPIADGDRAGEQLLCALFLAEGDSAVKEARAIESSMRDRPAARAPPPLAPAGDDRPLARPSTPGASSAATPASSAAAAAAAAAAPPAAAARPPPISAAVADIPDEMRSRPRIPRTPLGTSRSDLRAAEAAAAAAAEGAAAVLPVDERPLPAVQAAASKARVEAEEAARKRRAEGDSTEGVGVEGVGAEGGEEGREKARAEAAESKTDVEAAASGGGGGGAAASGAADGAAAPVHDRTLAVKAMDPEYASAFLPRSRLARTPVGAPSSHVAGEWKDADVLSPAGGRPPRRPGAGRRRAAARGRGRRGAARR